MPDPHLSGLARPSPVARARTSPPAPRPVPSHRTHLSPDPVIVIVTSPTPAHTCTWSHAPAHRHHHPPCTRPHHHHHHRIIHPGRHPRPVTCPRPVSSHLHIIIIIASPRRQSSHLSSSSPAHPRTRPHPLSSVILVAPSRYAPDLSSSSHILSPAHHHHTGHRAPIVLARA